jgi:lipopolysaccharide transport system ATP-binding protein
MSFIKLSNVEVSFNADFNKSIRRRFFNKSEIKKIVALNNINLEINENEKVGIIGGNGSGKTTLLKTIAKIYEPINGSVQVEGKISSLIDITMGLDEEANGYENIYLTAWQNIIPTKYIKKNIKKIIEFTELKNSLYRNVKTYSSGMKMRLASSIFINLKPEIFICDEFFSVGDANFKKKFERKMKDIIKKSGIFIFASHNIKEIHKYCNRKITLSKGKIINDERI